MNGEITDRFLINANKLYFRIKDSRESHKRLIKKNQNIEVAAGEIPVGPDGQPIEGAAPVQLGEDGQPIPPADVAEIPQPEPEPVIIKKKTPPPFEFKLDLPPEGAEVPFVRNCEFCCRFKLSASLMNRI